MARFWTNEVRVAAVVLNRGRGAARGNWGRLVLPMEAHSVGGATPVEDNRWYPWVRFADLESITFEPVEREGQKPSFKLICRAKDGDEVEIQKSTLLEAGLLNIFGKAMRAGVAIEGWGDAEVEGLETE